METVAEKQKAQTTKQRVYKMTFNNKYLQMFEKNVQIRRQKKVEESIIKHNAKKKSTNFYKNKKSESSQK